MAMAMKAAAAALAPKPCGLRGLFSTFTSTSPFFSSQPTQVEKPPAAEPSANLFVSGLSKRTTTEGLKEAFSKFGEVVNAKVVTDRLNGYSKGYGFVRYETIEQATVGMKGMDGQFLDGWVIFAEYARPRPLPGQAPPSDNNGSPYSHNRQNWNE